MRYTSSTNNIRQVIIKASLCVISSSFSEMEGRDIKSAGERGPEGNWDLVKEFILPRYQHHLSMSSFLFDTIHRYIGHSRAVHLTHACTCVMH